MVMSASPETMHPPAIILAGGKSSRMGSDKAGLSLAGRTLLEHVVRRLAPQVAAIAVNAPHPVTSVMHLPHVPDRIEGQLGPLAGILTGMAYLAGKDHRISHVLSVPCDSPFLPLDLVQRFMDTKPDPQTIVVASSANRRHPVFALWPTALAADLEHWLELDDNRRINAFIDRHQSVTVEFDPIQTSQGILDPFFNINSPDDLARAERFAEVLA
jgi:molybdopterin-guanine dinucleotide biosynthesis protein A